MKLVALLLVLACSSPLAAQERGGAPLEGASAKRAIRLLIERFHLFSHKPSSADLGGRAPSRDRLFHMSGDPDALFTLGDLGGSDTMRVKAALELNDVILHAITPDLNLAPSDTRQRAAGDYCALDAIGRPYQFRLGARLVW